MNENIKRETEPYEDRKSEEVQDIVDRMPTRWSAWTALVISVLMLVVFALSCIIEYPDTVSGSISLTATQAPVRLVAGASGRLHLLAANKSTVARGDEIAYMENGADIDDIRRLEKILDTDILSADTAFPTDLILGDLSTSYNSFVLSYNQYDMLRKTRVYSNMRKSLVRQIEADSMVAGNIDEELALKHALLAIRHDRLRKDSILEKEGAISKEEYNNQRTAWLTQREAGVSLKSTRLMKTSEINRNMTELSKVDIEETENLQKACADLLAKHNKLCSDIRQWKERNIFTARIPGRVEYLGFWRENAFVQAGQEVFSILPEKNDAMGEIYMPASGAGKVEPGQEVNIKLFDFPYNEYGLIKGRVKSISEITNKVSTDKGTVETYLVTVCLPAGTTTNYGKYLTLNFEAKGTADIITRQKRLIERLFDNLKAKQVK